MKVTTAVGDIGRERLYPVSLLLSAKWSGHSRSCPNPEGEFVGGSEMSLEQKKEGNRSERRMPPTAESWLNGPPADQTLPDVVIEVYDGRP